MTDPPALTLTDYVVLAALAITEGDVEKPFTVEELLVKVWQMQPSVFGLRGFERTFPDSNKLYTKIDGKDGLVSRGVFTKVAERTLQLTPSGLAAAARLKPQDQATVAKLHRTLQEKIAKIVSHPVFRDWQGDHSRPTRFREAGHFWGIAPGTPAGTVRDRVLAIDRVLADALQEMDALRTDVIVEQKGKPLFDRTEIERCIEFQSTLKTRFRKDLVLLDPTGPY